MFCKIFGRRISSPSGIFNGPFFDVRTLFVVEFDRLPSVCAVGDLEGTRAHTFINMRFNGEIVKTYQHSYFEYDDNAVVGARTIFQLTARRMIEVGPNYVEILHDGDFDWAHGLAVALAQYRTQPKETTIGFARNGSMN
jgi:hypothetical protein